MDQGATCMKFTDDATEPYVLYGFEYTVNDDDTIGEILYCVVFKNGVWTNTDQPFEVDGYNDNENMWQYI